MPTVHSLARWLAVIMTILISACDTNKTMQTKDDGTIILQHGTGEARHAILWLHGLGATADDFVPIVPELGLNPELPIRFVFPQAPVRSITINAGMRMPGWYDIGGLNIAAKEDLEGVTESRQTVEALIDEQIALGIPAENIILAGFSQGGAVTYYTAMRTRHKLAGILVLSTYLMFQDDPVLNQNDINLTTPVFASHGRFDPVVPLALGEAAVEKARALGYAVEWKTYPMEHQVMMEQILDIGAWINTVFAGDR